MGMGIGLRVEGGGGGYVKFGRFRGVPMGFLLICSISTTKRKSEVKRGGEGERPKVKVGPRGKN